MGDVSGSLEAAKGMVVSLDGVVDHVFLSQRDGKESAELTLRVRTADFNRVMGFLEAQGEVKSKEVREGTVKVELGEGIDRSSGGADLDEEPEASIELSLLEKDELLSSALVIGIIVAIGAVALLALLGTMDYIVSRAARRRRRNF